VLTFIGGIALGGVGYPTGLSTPFPINYLIYYPEGIQANSDCGSNLGI
jgi:hypothetical protein